MVVCKLDVNYLDKFIYCVMVKWFVIDVGFKVCNEVL